MPICPECGDEHEKIGERCESCGERYYIADEDTDRAEKDSYIGRKAADKYVVVSKISEGGMGAVYRALQLPVEREVALKVLLTELEDNDEVRDRFIREARAISKINHPNIITLHDFGFDGSNYPYMVMEYAPGVELDTWIRTEELDLQRILHVTHQILSALADAHQEGIVHRDLKPENVMVTGTGTDEDFIKILDFGIARLVNEKTAAGLTREGDVFGTPHYMSPEQAEGETGIGPPADVYAAGIIMYEMLCGEVPFDAPEPLPILFKQINEELPEIDARGGIMVPESVEKIVRKATRKDPEARFADAGEMLEALEDVDDATRSQPFKAPKKTLEGVGEATSSEVLDDEADEEDGDEEVKDEEDGDEGDDSEAHPVATANTMGFEDEEAEAVASSSSVTVASPATSETPEDDGFSTEQLVAGTARRLQRRTLMIVVALGALLGVALVAVSLFGGGEGERREPPTSDEETPAATTTDDEGSSGPSPAAATDPEDAGAPTRSGDTGTEAQSDVELTRETSIAPQKPSASDETSRTGSGEGRAGGRPAQKTETQRSGASTTPTGGAGNEPASDSGFDLPSPESESDDEPTEPPTANDDSRQPSGGPDPGSRPTTAEDREEEDDEGIEKFGAPESSDDDPDEPTKFGDPDG